MKIHTSTLHRFNFQAMARADERLAKVFVHFQDCGGSRSHNRAYNVRLTGSSPYAPQGMPGCKAATFEEWGYFIAAIFDAEPNAKVGHYKNAENFHHLTDNAFRKVAV